MRFFQNATLRRPLPAGFLFCPLLIASAGFIRSDRREKMIDGPRESVSANGTHVDSGQAAFGPEAGTTEFVKV